MSDWIPVCEAEPNGILCDLRYRDALGFYDVPGPFFFHDDGFWYRVNPPLQLQGKITHFRPCEEPAPASSDRGVR